MKSGKSVLDIRLSNRALLLEKLYFGGAMSRKKLSELAGLTAASVTQLTAGLIAQGALSETGLCPPQNRPGRAEQLVDICRGQLLALGIQLLPEEARLTVFDLSLSPLASSLVPMRADIFENSALYDAIDALTGELSGRIVAVGVTVRGIVDPISGVSIDSYGMLPRGCAIKQLLSRRLPWPVYTDNNVRAMLCAQGLKKPETAGGVKLLISYGPGIGSALSLGGESFLGAHFSACELGHVCSDDGGEKCVCGKRGCLETLLHFDRLVLQAGKILSPKETPALFSLCQGKTDALSAYLVYEAFALGDAGIRRLLEKPLRSFAMAIASSEAMYDPDQVLLCSDVFAVEPLCDYLEGEIRKRSSGSCPALTFIPDRDALSRCAAAAAGVSAFIKSGAQCLQKTN